MTPPRGRQAGKPKKTFAPLSESLLPRAATTSASDAEMPIEEIPRGDVSSSTSYPRLTARMVTFIRNAIDYVKEIINHVSDEAQTETEQDTVSERDKRHMKKIIYVVLLVLLLILGIMAFDLFSSGPPIHNDPRVCLSPPCIRASSRILSNLSPRQMKLDPCDDFHEFVCGGYEGTNSSSTFSDLADHTMVVLERLLESRAEFQQQGHDEQNIFGKMTHLYLSCLDTDAIESRGIAPLKKIVDKVSSLFPLSAPNYFTAQPKTNDVAEALSYLVSIGVSALLSVHIVIDRRNPGRRMIEFREPDFGLAINDYFLLSGAGMSRLQKYEDTITHAFTVFGYGNDATGNASYSKWRTGAKSRLSVFRTNHSRKMARLVIDVEKSMAHGLRADHEVVDTRPILGLMPEQSWNPMSLRQFEKLVPQLGAEQVITSLIGNSETLPEIINIRSLQYFINLANMLSESHATSATPRAPRLPRASMQAYFAWRTISSLQNLLSRKAALGSNALMPRQQECTEVVISLLEPILDHFYVRQELSPTIKNDSEELVAAVLRVIFPPRQDLPPRKMQVRIGYPRQLTNASLLSSAYQSLVLSSKAYFENTISATQHLIHQQFTSVNEDSTDWSPLSVSLIRPVPVYDVDGTILTIPASLLQPPVFDSSLPSSLNYGGLGGSLGSIAKQFLVLGESRRDALFFDMHGSHDLMEHSKSNSDAFGLQSVFEAWKASAQRLTETVLPGLEAFNSEESLFLSYGQLWCGDAVGMGPEGTPTHLKNRLNAAVKGSAAFRESWKCSDQQREI